MSVYIFLVKFGLVISEKKIFVKVKVNEGCRKKNDRIFLFFAKMKILLCFLKKMIKIMGHCAISKVVESFKISKICFDCS